MKSIIIIGGDKRQSYLKDIFKDKGFLCSHINSKEDARSIEKISEYDIVMLPLPVSKDKKYIYSVNEILMLEVEEVVSRLTDSQTVIGGSIGKALSSYLSEKNIKHFDYFSCEEFIVYNAYMTAQGALKLLLDNSEELIISKKALVTGFGRVAKALSKLLSANGVEVYVAARNKAQLVTAECCGYKTLNIDAMSPYLHLFDYIFNTVPSAVFTKEDISHVKGKYFELASKPFGAGKEWFKDKGKIYIDGGSLPGKFISYSSAERIAEISLEFIS